MEVRVGGLSTWLLELKLRVMLKIGCLQRITNISLSCQLFHFFCITMQFSLKLLGCLRLHSQPTWALPTWHDIGATRISLKPAICMLWEQTFLNWLWGLSESWGPGSNQQLSASWPRASGGAVHTDTGTADTLGGGSDTSSFRCRQSPFLFCQ